LDLERDKLYQRRGKVASLEQLQEIAARCSHFRNEEQNIENSSLYFTASCENCKHFTREHTCELDLIDKILISMPKDEC
jgi:hypothetical protein